MTDGELSKSLSNLSLHRTGAGAARVSCMVMTCAGRWHHTVRAARACKSEYSSWKAAQKACPLDAGPHRLLGLPRRAPGLAVACAA